MTRAELVMVGTLIFLPVALIKNLSAQNVDENNACCTGHTLWKQRKKQFTS
jgi:hypothetical protein